MSTGRRTARADSVPSGSTVVSESAVEETRLGRLVDLIWQTDEIRPERPTVVGEARSVSYDLEQLGQHAVPEVLTVPDEELARVGRASTSPSWSTRSTRTSSRSSRPSTR